MVFGGVSQEVLQVNEESIWAGPPVPTIKPDRGPHLDEARTLCFAGKYDEANRILREHVMAERISPRSQQPFRNVTIDFLHGEKPKLSAFRRDLNLDTALAGVSYTAEEVEIQRTAFVSRESDVLVFRAEAGSPGDLNCRIGLKRERGAMLEVADDQKLMLRGQASHFGTHMGVKFSGQLRMLPEGGELIRDVDGVLVKDADAVTLILAIATDYNFDDPMQPKVENLDAKVAGTLDAAEESGFAALRDAHIKDHQSLFHRMSLDLGSNPAREELPTDKRLQAFAEGGADPGLVTLHFHYGRYLLIGSSRPGNMPANLQGVWNDKLEQIWNSDYHININYQLTSGRWRVVTSPNAPVPFLIWSTT